MAKSRIVKHKGQWCIQCPYPAFDKPELIIHHWPIGQCDKRIEISEYEGAEVSKGGCSYEYVLRLAAYEYVRIYLKDQGQTQSIDTIIEPIPCPKVRKGIETRWQNGQWEKYMKSKGWVSA